MRPEDFSPGNHGNAKRWRYVRREASMRPEDFSPGNRPARPRSRGRGGARFNEAGGFLPRKPASAPAKGRTCSPTLQ